MRNGKEYGKREQSDKVKRVHDSQMKWSMCERLKFTPVTGGKQWNIRSKANTQFGCQIPTRASRKAKPRTKTISDSLRDTVSVYDCFSLRFTWMKFIWKPQVTTHKTESKRLPLHLSHIKGINLIDHEFLLDSIQLFYHCGLSSWGRAAVKRCVLTGELATTVERNIAAWEEFVSLSNGLACYSTLPSRQHRLSVLASCFSNSHCYSLTRMRSGWREELWRNRRLKKEREVYCILLRTEENRGERKPTGQGELFHWEGGTAAVSNPNSYPYLSSS